MVRASLKYPEQSTRRAEYFKVPRVSTRAGTYSFAFSGLKTTATTKTFMELRLNGGKIGNAYLGESGTFLTSSLHAILKLKVGDEITLVLTEGVRLHDDSRYYTHFTGILLEEDLVIS